MPTELITLVAALVLAWLVFTWLVRVIHTTLSTALTVAAIVLLLQLLFGIDPSTLWQEIQRFGDVLLEGVENLFQGES
ncbi:hypothetical protein E1H12_16440 [Geitlerinema sp. P-1104]|uniref:hypothetical protein n=1 Tax=Geitlerinema sp. P-1104 TaxID=2546230 RepID=UPI0014774751|nr:hypothetical protein [Geitlerinema sp. P-1104]NMG60061.1 hypothetical protein [Geitlerinema sp. P-1104]